MTRTFLRPTLATLACVAALAFAAPAMAAMMSMKADLKASNEVPPGNSKATGTVTVTYDPATKKLSWKGSYSGLSGPATAAHFHGPASSGKNAGVMVPINPHGASFEGSATLNDAQANALMGGNMYVNIHTAAHKAGEIRGQVVK
jgi:Cu/Zn superoxide dismutase